MATRIDEMIMDAIILVSVGLIIWLLATGDDSPQLPPCQDDAPEGYTCIWEADKQGNGEGSSFIHHDGNFYYLEGEN